MRHHKTIRMDKSKQLNKILNVLAEFSTAIVATDNLKATAEYILRLALEYCPAEKTSLMLINENNELYIMAAIGIEKEFIDQFKIKIGEGISGSVAKDQIARHVMDISKDPKFPKRHRYKTGSFISCPINNKKKVIGVLNISDKKDGTPFTEFEFELMTSIADKVADVIENACLVLELKVKNEQLEQTQKMLMDMERLTHRIISNIFQISRNSLNSITGAAYFLENSSEQSLTDKQDFYKIIYKESQTITQLIDFLPVSTRIENETFFIPKTQVELKKILYETLGSSILKKSLAKKNIRIELDDKQKVSDILGDKNSVKKFFKFLMEGLCYFFHDGIIDIHLWEDKYLQIDVVVPAEISYNFSSEAESFTWGESIGDFFITYARKIAEAHQWCMTLENRSGQSVFRIQIPNHSKSKSADFITRGTDVVLTLTAQILEPETCSLFLKDKLTSGLTLKGAFCHTKDFIQKPIKLSYEDRIVGWVSIEGKPLFQVPNLDPRSFICLPLMSSNKLIGVLTLNKKKNGEIYRNKDFLFSLFLGDILSEFAESLFDNFLTEEVFITDVNLLENLTHIIQNHNQDIGLKQVIAYALMNRLAKHEEQMKLVLYSIAMRDLGWEEIHSNKKRKGKQHPPDKYYIFSEMRLENSEEFSNEIRNVILHLMENYNGTGQPHGLQGHKIPFASRVIRVVDAFYTILKNLPTYKFLSQEDILLNLKAQAGTLYDPSILYELENIIEIRKFGLNSGSTAHYSPVLSQ